MEFRFAHFNFNVMDLDKSIAFYDEAVGLKVQRVKEAKDGSYKIAFLTDNLTSFALELTWLKDRKEPYDLGDEEFHLAFQIDDFDQAYEKHKAMGVICYENPAMGIYFIQDPDGYWIEIVPIRK